MTRTQLAIILATLLVAGAITQSALAHSFGESLIKEVDGYSVDIGVTSLAIQAGDSTAFDFALEDTQTRAPVPFTSVWLRISSENKTVFASSIGRPSIGPSSVVFTFPAPGSYELQARYTDNDNTLAEASFPLKVGPGSSGSKDGSFSNTRALAFLLVGGGIGLIGGYVTSMAFKKRRN